MAKRKRATVVVKRKNLILLVRGKGEWRFGLPGGGIEKAEPTLITAAREVFEETQLHLSSIQYVGDVERTNHVHFVFLAKSYGRVRLKSGAMTAYKWWDGKESIQLQNHVIEAIALVEGANHKQSKKEL